MAKRTVIFLYTGSYVFPIEPSWCLSMITCNRSAFNCVLEMHASQNLTKLGGHKVLGMVGGGENWSKLCS